MPELPEVETVKKGLIELLNLSSTKSTVITSVELKRKNLRTPISKKLGQIKNIKLTNIERRAKYILWQTEKGVILNHLGMTGCWREVHNNELVKHDHVVLHFANGQSLAYNDPRRFGIMEFIAVKKLTSSKWLKNLGPEPLDKDQFTCEYMFTKTRKRQRAIKNLIMDQKIVVGVGNIYASEALFLAGIRPSRRAYNMSLADCTGLVKCISQILKEAIAAGGTTIRDFRQAGGEEGYFARSLNVYGRAGEECSLCASPIKKKDMGGRSTFWCSKCQK